MRNFDELLDNFVVADTQEFEDKHAYYLFGARDINSLPEEMKNALYTEYKGYPIIYAGITTSLMYRRHLNGSARNSTLRKSLGTLLNLRRKKLKGRKYRFTDEHEKSLTEWMEKNLIMFYATEGYDLEAIEKYLIEKFNPPLNLKNNDNEINKEFRALVKEMRNKK